MNQGNKTCQNCKKDFTIDPQDFTFYEKVKVPPPTFCPDCRLQRRLAFQNQRSLYKRKCNLCGKDIVSMYREDVFFPVYCMTCWESDSWDPTSFGMKYDFNKPFFEQLAQLTNRVPRKALMGLYPTWHNSEYNNMCSEIRNCYLTFNSDVNEDCMYGSEIEKSKNCVDVTKVDGCESTYASVGCNKCHSTYFSFNCEDCHGVWFSKDLVNCSDCFGCVALRGKKYHIYNEPYSKEDYAKKLEEIDTSSYEGSKEIMEKVDALYTKAPKRFMHGRHNTSVSGEYVDNSKETYDTYIATGAENCRYCMWLVIKPSKDCYDYTQFGGGAQDVYESLTCGLGINDVKFSQHCTQELARVEYADSCHHASSDIFGCTGLRKKQYCILNKQYTKEEYEELIPKIKKHMDDMPYTDKKGRVYKYGEFPPIEIAPYKYNETDAQEYFPLSKDQVVEAGYEWLDFEEKPHTETVSWKDFKDTISEVDDSITKEVILCEEWDKDSTKATEKLCTKVFRIIPREFDFYKTNNLPLPRKCPNCRHFDRVSKRNSVKFWTVKCSCAGKASEDSIYTNDSEHSHGADHCPNEFVTSYNPENKNIVYCEQCYQGEVV